MNALPQKSEWAFAGIGRHQKKMIAMAVAEGGNVRVGMEDAPSQPDEDDWSNMKAVSFAVSMAKSLGRPIATPAEARQRLGLS